MNINNDYQTSVGQYYLYPTMGCSLSCAHCFIDDKIRNSKMSMSESDFMHIVDQYAKHFSTSSANHAEITIMGGEPTTLKPEFYEKVIPHIRERFKATGKYFYITLMTNFLHYSCLDKIAKHFDFIATSYEPKRFSAEANSSSKESVWLKNLSRFIASGRDVTLSFTTTRDVIEQGTSLYDRFFDIGVRYFQINKAFPEGQLLKDYAGQDSVKNYHQQRHEELMKPARKRKLIQVLSDSDRSRSLFVPFDVESDYLILVANWLVDKLSEGNKVSVDPLLDYPLGIFTQSEIGDLACGAGKGFSVRSDGLTTGCAAEIGNINPLSFGNMLEEDIVEIENSLVRKNLLKAQSRVRRECMSCEFYKCCLGGCMLRSRAWDSSVDKDCHGNKKFLSYISDNKEKFLRIRGLQ